MLTYEMSSLGKLIALNFTLFLVSLYTCSKHRRNPLSITITMHLFINTKFSSNGLKKKRKKKKRAFTRDLKKKYSTLRA